MITTMRRAAAGLIAALIVPVLAGCGGGSVFDLAVEGCVTDEDDGRHLYVTDEAAR